jgi:arginase
MAGFYTRTRIGSEYTGPVVEVLGVPFDLCGFRRGSRLGPDALRLAGLEEALKALGVETSDCGNLALPPDGNLTAKQRWDASLEMLAEVKRQTGGSLSRGRTPLVIGGEHSLSIGSISAGLDARGESLAVLWIDAHADLNTPSDSPSGNLHGMPLSALMGIGAGEEAERKKEWSRILDEVVPGSRLSGARTAWIGLREVDPGERRRLAKVSGEYTATMYDIDRFGLVESLMRFDRWMRSNGATALWISFDVDALDPILAPGTGTTVRGGLTYREMHLSGELLFELLSAKYCPYRLLGIDLVEVNPLFDTNNETARTAVEWIASLFGQTILGKR